jgi:RNA polymerase sigma-70 factor (ECF subfamily)
VAVANVDGAEAGIKAVEAIRNRGDLGSYYLLYAVLGEFEAQLHNFQAAAGHFRKALELTDVKSEKSFLSKRLRDCEVQGRHSPATAHARQHERRRRARGAPESTHQQ